MSSFYQWQLVVLGSACLLLLSLEEYALRKTTAELEGESNASPAIVSRLSRRYLCVYAIVMGADWLQGPYIYSLYREQYELPERLVALLFVLGFLAAGIAAPLVGIWADQYGRRRMCLVFCAAYAMACALIQVPSVPVLFVGRLLGGLGTAILFSSFESWLVASANTLTLSSRDLSTVLGRATLVNSIAAAVAGVASNKLVENYNSFAAPFTASGVLLLLASIVISFSWSENYGAAGATADLYNLSRLSEAWTIVRADKRLLVLGLVQTCFEGSMYLFVFVWVPFLQEAASRSGVRSLPLGYIFSSFMVSMTLGSVLYTLVVSRSHFNDSRPRTHEGPPDALGPNPSYEAAIALHAKLSVGVCIISAVAFISSVAVSQEHMRFWAFCVYEACVGMYYPVQGMLRGRLVQDEHRATLSSLFRVPLNVFVVISLMTGVSSARRFVLSACAGLLLCSALVTTAAFLPRAPRTALATLRTR